MSGMVAVVIASTLIGLAAFAVFRLARRRPLPKLEIPSPGMPLGAGAGRRSMRGIASAPLRIAELQSRGEDSYSRQEEREDLAILCGLLDDLRDLYGGDEAIFWQWIEERDMLTPAAWSGADAERPRYFRRAEWAPLVQAAAQARGVRFDGAGPDVRLVASPVVSDGRLLGVLSVGAAKDLRAHQSQLQSWIPRHVAQVERLLALFDIRREYGRHMRQGRALLHAVQRLKSHPSQEALVRRICETAIEVSSATESALVRWRSERGKGTVQFATPGFKRRPPFEVSEDSLIAQVCRSRRPLVIEDASRLAPDVNLFFSGDGECREGAFAIIPLSRDNRVLGAIVAAAARVGGVRQDEARNLDILGAVATTSLEIVWDLEEASRRARTDPLTGLANRRAFDERLEQALNEGDRFGVPVSLVLADLDHFKRINDTWGHEAGDLVLTKVARLLADHVRAVDTVARYGGEEIAILLPQTSMTGAVDLADRLRRALSGRTIAFNGTEIMVTASFGVASYPEAAVSRDALFPSADRALYEAKHSGRNCVRSATANTRGPTL